MQLNPIRARLLLPIIQEAADLFMVTTGDALRVEQIPAVHFDVPAGDQVDCDKASHGGKVNLSVKCGQE